MASQHGNLRLLWETTSKPMLPSFRRVSTAPWIRDPDLWRGQHAKLLKGQLVQWSVCRDLAVWVLEQLDVVTTDGSPALRQGTLDGRCCLLSRHKCNAVGGARWLVGAYAKLLVGHDEGNMPVYEYAHRLVAWACGGWSQATNVTTAKHTTQPTATSSSLMPHSHHSHTATHTHTHTHTHGGVSLQANTCLCVPNKHSDSLACAL